MMGLVKDLFEQGEYAQVLEKTYEDRKKVDPTLYSYIIGSLIFLGRTEEAQAYYQSLKKELTPLQRSYSYFFLAIGLTRRSQYARARQYLILNRRLSKSLSHEDTQIRFLMEQGISFFLFFLGQFEKSLGWSQKSLSTALNTQDYWMKALSYDLLANNLVQTGKIHEGLQHFEEAIKFAHKLKNIALIQAFETSHLIFRCEFGIHIQKSFNELEKKFYSLADKDAFSKANLGLEYVRQLTLRGDWSAALNILEEIASLIYQSHNRRQEARLNLRWAEIYFLKNEPISALHYIRSGKRCLEFIDQTYEIQFLGLEIKVYEILKKQDAPAELKTRLQELSQKYNSIKNNNMLSRDSASLDQPAITSDDEIHFLLLKAQQNEAASREIILMTDFLSWLYRFFPIERGENVLLLNLEPKSITCLSKNGISHKTDELSSLVFKILTTLSQGFTSKETLVNAVWGYTYDPLRHDSLIYSAFSSLRKTLGAGAGFIETSEMGYKLNARVLNLFDHNPNSEQDRGLEAQPLMQSLSSSVFEKTVALAKQGLNSRQIQILSYLEQNQFVSVKTVVTLFLTSEITANRDLRSLYEKKLVIRVGQGRATQYSKNIATQ
jgi:DNA-binding winged helix-turn-helix (wHTH) protein